MWCLIVISVLTLSLILVMVVPGHKSSQSLRVLTIVRQGNKRIVVLLDTKSGDEGVTFFDALSRVTELNKLFGTSARLVSHRTAEVLLATRKHNDELVDYSPFWTGTLIAYETRRAEKLGETISSYHHPKDDRPLYTAQFPTGQFCGGTKCALTVEGLTEGHFRFDDEKREIVINSEGLSVAKTEGFPDHPTQLHQDEQTGVPSSQATSGRRLWLIRADRPVLWSGLPGGELVNPFFDNYVGPIVRSAPLPNAAQADEAFVANTEFFKKYGVLLEMDEEEFTRIK